VTGVVAWDVSGHWTLASNLRFEFVHVDERSSYETRLVHTLIASTTWLAPVELQVEYVGKAPISSSGGYRPALGSAVMFHLNENVQLDAEVRVGFGSAQDYESQRRGPAKSAPGWALRSAIEGAFDPDTAR
jgi:hypothetical protein